MKAITVAADDTQTVYEGADSVKYVRQPAPQGWIASITQPNPWVVRIHFINEGIVIIKVIDRSILEPCTFCGQFHDEGR